MPMPAPSAVAPDPLECLIFTLTGKVRDVEEGWSKVIPARRVGSEVFQPGKERPFGDVLLLDLGEAADSPRTDALDSLLTYAREHREHPTLWRPRFAATLLVGSIERLGEPLNLLALRADCVLPAWPDAATVLELWPHVREVALRRIRAHQELELYRRLKADFRFGVYQADAVSGELLWYDADAARIFELPPWCVGVSFSMDALLPRHTDRADLTGRLHEGRGRPISEVVELRRGDGPERRVRLSEILDVQHAGRERIKGIVHDFSVFGESFRRFNDLMTTATLKASGAEGGIQETVSVLAEAVADLFGATACAVMMRDAKHRKVFPLHIWRRGGAWSGLHVVGAELILDEDDHPGLQGLARGDRHCVTAAPHVLTTVRPFFNQDADGLMALGVLALPSLEGEAEGYFWVPLHERPPFRCDEQDFSRLIGLCTRQIQMAAGRDAARLASDMLNQRRASLSLAELDKVLDEMRQLIQSPLPMEGCSIFRTGVEDQRDVLVMVSTSGLVQGETRARYALNETTLTATVARKGAPFVTYDKEREHNFKGRHVEKTIHPGRTWAGIPMRDRAGRTVGIIRCVNRVVGNSSPAVTSFSRLDMRVLTEFANACALMVELVLLQEGRTRTLRRLSHELRNSAAGVRSNLSYLIDNWVRFGLGVNLEAREKLEDLDLDTEVLVNQLHQVNLLSGQAPFAADEKKVDVYLAEIVHKTVRQLIPEIKARDLDWGQVTVDLRALPRLPLPRAAVAQLVFNLVYNAIKYSDPNDPSRFKITIRAEVPRNESVFEVHFMDWGIGVEEEAREAIFSAEFRSPAARRHDQRGFGLGLAISRSIAKQIGGDLFLRSPRNPTTFVWQIPK